MGSFDYFWCCLLASAFVLTHGVHIQICNEITQYDWWIKSAQFDCAWELLSIITSIATIIIVTVSWKMINFDILAITVTAWPLEVEVEAAVVVSLKKFIILSKRDKKQSNYICDSSSLQLIHPFLLQFRKRGLNS